MPSGGTGAPGVAAAGGGEELGVAADGELGAAAAGALGVAAGGGVCPLAGGELGVAAGGGVCANEDCDSASMSATAAAAAAVQRAGRRNISLSFPDGTAPPTGAAKNTLRRRRISDARAACKPLAERI